MTGPPVTASPRVQTAHVSRVWRSCCLRIVPRVTAWCRTSCTAAAPPVSGECEVQRGDSAWSYGQPRYQEYGDTCPGLTWSEDGENVVDEAIVYGEGGADNTGSLTEWPNALIQ